MDKKYIKIVIPNYQGQSFVEGPPVVYSGNKGSGKGFKSEGKRLRSLGRRMGNPKGNGFRFYRYMCMYFFYKKKN